MTPQERELLNAFLGNLTAMSAPNTDRAADELIRNAFARQPNAGYLLVQQALLQQMALRDAQDRIAELEQQVRQPQRPGPESRFLGGAAPGRSVSVPPAAPAAGGWSSGRGTAPPVTTAAAQRTSGMGDFLRSAATTAAGVAGGALLFQGIENLIGGHRSESGGGFLGGRTPEIVENNTVINEYLDQRPPREDLDDDQLAGADFSDDESLTEEDGDSGGWV